MEYEYYYPFKTYPLQQTTMLYATYRQNIFPCYYPFIPMDEVFVQISDYFPFIRDYFWISNYGRIYNANIRHLSIQKLNHAGYPVALLKRKPEYTDPNKYHGANFVICTHILVCTIFNGPPPGPEYEVNHIDFNRQNCYYKNLEWLTHDDNVMHSYNANRWYREDGTSKSSKYDKEIIHKLCQLMESGVHSTTQLSLLVFGQKPSIAIKDLIDKIKNRGAWTNISSQYQNIPYQNKMQHFLTDDQIHAVCLELQTNGLSISARDIAINILHIDYDSFPLNKRYRFNTCIADIKRRNVYSYIVDQYQF